MTPWQYETFYTYGDGKLVSQLLAKFLNRRNIKEFHIIVQKAEYVEIIYREEAR